MSQLIGTDPDVDQELATSASASPAARRWPRLLFSPRLLAAGAGLAVLVGAVAILRSGGHRPSTTAKAATSTATVAARDLVNREQVNGTLGYAAMPAALVASQPGVLTALAAEGAVVGRGQQLFVVDTQPVVVLFGPMPAYRDLVEGMSGADVRQLKENLV
ncbi:MAG: rane fusion protein multidrug efflux system, partial [Actinomycetota bacterium]|nr:rane fusion protein multidrug efflux system [Actinomycetota bacterium]